MKHVVTGSRGFLGSHLMRDLGDDAVGVDLPECDVLIPDDPEHPNFGYRMGLGGHPDVVWHLAALNDATQTFYDRPWDVLNTQIRGTLNVIDACVANGVKTLVLFSSSEVYQTPPVIPTPEDVPFSIPDMKNPRYSYAAGKQAAEMLCWYSGIERVVCIRPHNVIGPGQRPGHVVADFIERAATLPPGAAFEIHGASSRSFIYVDDFVDACLAIAKHVDAQPGRVREVYHVGTEEQVTTVALAGQICRLMGRYDEARGAYQFKFKTKPGPAGGANARCPSVHKLRQLGWKPKVSLGEGLRRTVEAWREKKVEIAHVR